MRKFSRWALGILLIAAGTCHFLRPDLYLRIVPPALPWPGTLVALSGAIEIGIGLLLLPRRTAPWAAWGAIALFVAVFPANLYMAAVPERFPSIPVWLLWARLPLQAVLVAWAWVHARRGLSSFFSSDQ